MNITTLKNLIPCLQKQYFVRTGKNHVFGTDFELRESMSDRDAESLFDQIWESTLKDKIINGKFVERDSVLARINPYNKKFLKEGQILKEFKESGSVWIAQLSDLGENNQLWIISNKAYDTRSVTATFRTQQEKDSFVELAGELGIEPNEYARQILTSHLENILPSE